MRVMAWPVYTCFGFRRGQLVQTFSVNETWAVMNKVVNKSLTVSDVLYQDMMLYPALLISHHSVVFILKFSLKRFQLI